MTDQQSADLPWYQEGRTVEQRRALGHELRKLAEAIRLGQTWSPMQGVRATQITHLIRCACFEERLSGDR